MINRPEQCHASIKDNLSPRRIELSEYQKYLRLIWARYSLLLSKSDIRKGQRER